MTDIVEGGMSDKSQLSDIDLRTRIAAVLSGHRPRGEEWVTCSCDDDFSRFAVDIYEQHVADAVIRELKLEKQTLNREWWAAAPNVCRYVTEWEPDETD